MSTTLSDTAMDKFMEIQELYQMDTVNLEDFLDRVTVRLNYLIAGREETEKDAMDEYEKDMQDDREVYDDHTGDTMNL